MRGGDFTQNKIKSTHQLSKMSPFYKVLPSYTHSTLQHIFVCVFTLSNSHIYEKEIDVILLIIKATVNCSVLCPKEFLQGETYNYERFVFTYCSLLIMIFIFNSITNINYIYIYIYIPREINSHCRRHRYTHLPMIAYY